MLKHGLSKSVLLIFIASSVLFTGTVKAEHPFNGSYTGRNLDRIAFPIGGFGSGMFCLEGNASISHMSVMHHMDFFNEPVIFAAVCVKGKTVGENCARVLEGPIPDYKYFGRPGSGNCSVDHRLRTSPFYAM